MAEKNQPPAPRIMYRVQTYDDTSPTIYGLFVTNPETGVLCIAIDTATAPIQSPSQALLRAYAAAFGWTEQERDAIIDES